MVRPSRKASSPSPREPHPPARKWLAAGGLLALGTLALAALWFGQLPVTRRPARDLNVLLLTLDTTRADRLGIYGDPHGASPNLDRLGRAGVVFEQAIAAAPLTLPSHTTLFTGMLPPAHGVRDNGGYIVNEHLDTLAEILRAQGRRTGGFVSAYVLDAKWGLDQGFEQYFDEFDLSGYKSISLGDVSRPANDVVDAAIPWLDAHASEPFFAWLHFFDPHSPYDPPEPFKSRFADKPYLGEIAFMDAQIGRVLEWIEDRGLRDRTIVVAIGDHGESLGEHGESTHGLFVYDATVRVPFIARVPEAAARGRRVPSVVRTEDVLPTLLDLLGLPVPAQVQGQSLLPLMTGRTADLELDAYSESYYARFHFGWSELKALRAGRFKYIQAPRPELFDMQEDPGERRNLVEERAPLAERLARALEATGAAEPTAADAPGAVDPETRERLAALGYIGSFTGTTREPGDALADPKDKIAIFNRMLSARENAGREGRTAIDELKAVLAEDPTIIDAWLMLGNEYFSRRDYAAALPCYRRALELKPDYDLATINMANAYRQLGDEGAAIVGYERYLSLDPNNAYVRYLLGDLYTERGELARAEEMFRGALAADSRLASARNALAVVALKRGDYETAEREVRAALEMSPRVRFAYFNLALVAEARGRLQQAFELYHRELELHPHNYKAAFNLGKLYEQTGDRQNQLAAFRRAVEQNPRFGEGYLYLAKLLLDLGELDEAMVTAKRGLEVTPNSPYAALGYYVLADVHSRRGRPDLAEQEAARGRAAEARVRPRASS